MTEHKLKLIVDDSKIRELETRLGRSIGIDQKNNITSIFGGNAGKNIAKLGVIATGVGAAVGALDKLVKFSMESSGHAQASLKIWDTAMRMFFRPVGDTIGLVLRPFALMMLKWAIPFYRSFAENIDEIQTGREKIGEGKVTEGVGDIKGAWLDIIFGEGAGDWQREISGKAQDLHDWLFGWISNVWNIPEAGAVMDETSESAEHATDSLNGFNMTLQKLYEDTNNTTGEITNFIGWLREVGNEIRRRLSIEGNPDTGVIGGGARTDFGSGSTHRNQGITTKTETARKLYNRWISLGVSEDKVMSALEERGLPTGDIFGDPNIGGKRNSGQGVNINSTIQVYGAVDENTLDAIAKKSAEQITQELKKFPGRFG